MGFNINTLRDKVVRGQASRYERYLLEYYEYTSPHGHNYDVPYQRRAGDPVGMEKLLSSPFSPRNAKMYANFRIAAEEADEAQTSYLHREARAARERFPGFRRLDDIQKVTYNPTPGTGFFTQGNPYAGFKLNLQNLPRTRPIVTFDIETDDLQRPVSISAIKQMWNEKTQKLQTVDSLQRFYLSEAKNLVRTNPVHGFTARSLAALRNQQGATYGTTYDATEKQAVKDFFGNAILVGHNVVDFDIQKLFGMQLPNQVIDTMITSQNIWGQKAYTGGKGTKYRQQLSHGLDEMFQRITGKTMEQAGLSHHDANADVVATAVILEALLKGKGQSGRELRALLTHPELKYGKLETLPYHKGGDRTSALFMGYSMNSMQTIENYYKSQDFLESMSELSNGKLIELLKEGPMGIDWELMARRAEETGIMESATQEQMQYLNDKITGLSGLVEIFREMKATEMLSKRASWIRTLASAEPDDMQTVASSLGITGDATDLIESAQRIRSGRERKTSFNQQFSLLKKMYGQGMWDTTEANMLRKTLGESDYWGANNSLTLNTLQNMYQEKQFRDLMGNDKITQSQKEYIAQLQDEGASYDELNAKIKELIQNNAKMTTFVGDLTNIRAYDPNQYVNSAKQQWGGIMGAAKGVVPSFLLEPLSRIGAGAFNAVDKGLVGYNRFMSVWNSGVGKATMSGLGALGAGAATGAIAGSIVPGVGTAAGAIIGGVAGGIKGITQIVGNYQQGKMEKIGYDIQNSLNTTGLIISWVAAPFKLLAKVTKQLIGGFTALLAWLKRLMSSGIDLMSQMGNPLTELTGANYSVYQGSNLMDIASLLSKGSTNSLYEKLATNQRGLFTLGQFNENSLIAASMLGVFQDAYVPGENASSATNAMINKLLAMMDTQTPDQQARTMYLAGLIDESIPQLLHSARLLGVTDINQLANPRSRGIYWNPITEGEEKRFRWTQYEYGAVQEGFNNSKMRVANYLWSAFGKDLYNGLNRTMDRIASGDWKGAFDSVADMWDGFKKKVVGIWESFKAKLSEKDSNGMSQLDKWYNNFIVALDKIGIAGLKMLQVILKGWNELVGTVIQKSQGLIAYLSTLKVDVSFKNGKINFDVESIGDRTKNVKGSDAAIWSTWDEGGIRHDEVAKGMGSVVEFAGAMGLYGRTLDTWKSQMYSRVMEGKGQASVGGVDLWLSSKGDVDKLFNLLLMLGDNPTDMERAAAWFSSGFRPGSYQNIIDATGVSKFYKTMSSDVDGILDNVIENAIQALYTDSLHQHTLPGGASELTININTNGKPAASGTAGEMVSMGTGIRARNNSSTGSTVTIEGNKR